VAKGQSDKVVRYLNTLPPCNLATLPLYYFFGKRVRTVAVSGMGILAPALIAFGTLMLRVPPPS
jgi:hypothetical protein